MPNTKTPTPQILKPLTNQTLNPEPYNPQTPQILNPKLLNPELQTLQTLSPKAQHQTPYTPNP